MGALARQPEDEERRRALLAQWERIQQELAEAQAGMTNEERKAAIDEINDTIDERMRAVVLELRGTEWS